MCFSEGVLSFNIWMETDHNVLVFLDASTGSYGGETSPYQSLSAPNLLCTYQETTYNFIERENNDKLSTTRI